MNYQCISADSHINEPPDLWSSAAPASIRDEVPRVVQTADGDCWSAFPGSPLSPMKTAGAAGRDPKDYGKPLTYKEMRPGSFDPVPRLADMDADGIDAEVLYPGTARLLAKLPTREIRIFCARAYNDWMIEFCRKSPERLIGLAILPPIDDEGAAAEELKRVAKHGIRGAWLAQAPEGVPLNHPLGESLWASAAQAKIPVSLHIGSGVFGVNSGENGRLPGARETALATRGLMMAEHVGALVFSGVPSRYRDLRIVVAESGVGWLTFFTERMDGVYDRHRHYMKTDMNEKPSEVVRRAIFATFIDETAGLLTRELVGNNIMWSTDYPHTDTTWPHSQEVMQRLFGDFSEAERKEIVCGNAARLYRLAA